MISEILLLLLLTTFDFSSSSWVSLRGGDVAFQRLPVSLTNGWQVSTYDIQDKLLNEVEIGNEESLSWVNPTSFDSLYLPADLPYPRVSPALGVVLQHGSVRYIMPSLILSLETPDRLWRNRGLCSLPRASAWIDLYGPFVPKLSDLRMSFYGQVAPNLRFLEDQDGNTAWSKLLDVNPNLKIKNDYLSSNSFNVESILETFKEDLKNLPNLQPLRSEGYHFVDIPILDRVDSEMLSRFVPPFHIKAYLTDFDDAASLIEFEGSDSLNFEPCGELDIKVERVGAGRDSKFLPEAYLDLYEEGNILA